MRQEDLVLPKPLSLPRFSAPAISAVAGSGEVEAASAAAGRHLTLAASSGRPVNAEPNGLCAAAGRRAAKGRRLSAVPRRDRRALWDLFKTIQRAQQRLQELGTVEVDRIGRTRARSTIPTSCASSGGIADLDHDGQDPETHGGQRGYCPRPHVASSRTSLLNWSDVGPP